MVVKQWLGDGISNVEWMTPLGGGESAFAAASPSGSPPLFSYNSIIMNRPLHICTPNKTAHLCEFHLLVF